MQIVIDILKGTYKSFIDERTGTTEILQAVRHGTPLPKGHGRLIDESKITKWCYMPINQLDARGIRTDAPTIIEGSESE